MPVDVPAQLFGEIKTVASQLRVPVKSVLLAAYVAMLARTGRGRDVLTGLVSGGRPELLDSDRILGQFLNTVPLRVRVAGSWANFICRVFETETALFDYRRFPVLEMQRTHHGKPLFESAFNYIHFHVYQTLLDRPDLGYLGGQFTDPFHFPMTVNARVHPITGDLAIVVNYATNQLTESHALDFAHGMIEALLAITTSLDTQCVEWTGVQDDRADAEVIQAGIRSSRVQNGRRHSLPHAISARESELLDVWEAVLGIEGIDVHDDFFDLGGDSILSIQICARARQLGHAIRPKSVFDNPSVRLLSAHIEGSDATPESFTASRAPLRATPEQLFRMSGSGNLDWDNVSLVVKLREPLDEERLIASVATVLARHEALRVAVELRPDGHWWQKVSAIPATEVVQRQGDQDFDSWLAEANRSLRLAEGRVFRMGQHSGHLALIAHHAVADAVSLQLVLSDLIVTYTTGSSLLDSGVPLAALGFDAQSDGETWHRMLSDGHAQVLSGRDHPNIHADERVVEGVLDDETTNKLIQTAADARVNVLHLILVATATLLGRQANRPSVVLDVMTNGRDRTEIAEAVGCLAAPVAVAIRSDATKPLLAASEAKNAVDAVIPERHTYLALRAEEPHLDFPDVMVNYLGRFSNFPDPVVDVLLVDGMHRDPERQRSHPLELQSVIFAGRLMSGRGIRKPFTTKNTSVRLLMGLCPSCQKSSIGPRSTRHSHPVNFRDSRRVGQGCRTDDQLSAEHAIGAGATAANGQCQQDSEGTHPSVLRAEMRPELTEFNDAVPQLGG